MKRYRIKVIEKHSDIVEIDAESKEEAEDVAVLMAETQYELLYDTEVLSEEEIT